MLKWLLNCKCKKCIFRWKNIFTYMLTLVIFNERKSIKVSIISYERSEGWCCRTCRSSVRATPNFYWSTSPIRFNYSYWIFQMFLKVTCKHKAECWKLVDNTWNEKNTCPLLLLEFYTYMKYFLVNLLILNISVFTCK